MVFAVEIGYFLSIFIFLQINSSLFEKNLLHLSTVVKKLHTYKKRIEGEGNESKQKIRKGNMRGRNSAFQ